MSLTLNRTRLALSVALILSLPAAHAQPIQARAVIVEPGSAYYGAELMKAGVQGTSVVSGMLQNDGSLQDLAIQASSRSAALDEAALVFVKTRHFKAKGGEADARPMPLLVPVEFMKDDLFTLDRKTCADLNVDVAYKDRTFPEDVAASPKVVEMAVGLLTIKAMQGGKDKQRAYLRGVKPAVANMRATCQAQPDKLMFEVLSQALKDEAAKP